MSIPMEHIKFRNLKTHENFEDIHPYMQYVIQ